MISKPVVLGLLAAACLTAAAGGAYVAVRQNEAVAKSPVAQDPATQPSPGPAVAESEAIVTPPAAAPEVEIPSPARTKKPAPATTDRPSRRESSPAARSSAPLPSGPDANRAPARSIDPPATSAPAAERVPAARETPGAPAPAPPVSSLPEPVISDPPPAPARQFIEVVVPASSVVGLKVETSLSSETARVEDRVEARVTREVIADGRIAIPAGTRVIGDVMAVERGGKMKDKARLGVRFHTLVLADGNPVPLRTDAIFREGSSPGAESARKIGGAAIGGAVLGAIIGGAKGAAIGGATGAAGGSAVVMAGDRNAATLPFGTIVTVRLTSPVVLEVEREAESSIVIAFSCLLGIQIHRWGLD